MFNNPYGNRNGAIDEAYDYGLAPGSEDDHNGAGDGFTAQDYGIQPAQQDPSQRSNEQLWVTRLRELFGGG